MQNGSKVFTNKKAQKSIVIIMVAIMVFIMATVMIEPIQDETEKIRLNETNLNCTNPNVTHYENATCIIVDMYLFYFISVLIAISIALVSGKRTITGVITAITTFIVVVVLIAPLKEWIVLARDATHLNCTNTSISVAARMTCIFVDLWLFYFIAICIASAITYIFVTKVVKDK